MNATIHQTESKTIIIEEPVLLKELGIDPKNFRIESATMAYGASFHEGGNALHLKVVEIPEHQKRSNR